MNIPTWTLRLVYSTHLEGGNDFGIAVDSSGYIYVTGNTLSTDFPILNQYQTDQKGRDAYVAKLIFTMGVPTMTTTGVSSVTATSASSGGNVISDEGAIVTARGICWSTSSNPSVSGSHTTDGSGLGSFTSSITGLTSNTTYYVRAYATNSIGTAYGNEVTFTTENGSTEPPKIKLNRTHLTFGAVTGGATTGSQTFLVSNSGGGSLNWNASVSDTWLEVSPFSGTADMIVTVSVDVTGLVSGSYTGNITMTDPNADNSPVSLYIYLEVKEKTQEMPPFGSFDSPLDGSGVSGSIPVTGWALDDVEVSTVKIFRSPVQGHETGLVYIGDAVFVEGARPDVEGKFPGYPKNYKAGWGYMMLTNFLPNGGNGTFTITAIVTDSSENEVTLGSKTIICGNASAVKPFGAIDTPTQGGEASGTDFVNFGWALTPLPNTIPTDGSTIKVWVDGVPLPGNPVYNNYRGDIANAFPNTNNSHGAVGYYYLDTTLYANGIHTIAWSVKDNVGNADGIGSRYFSIQNSHRAWSMEHGVGLASHGAVPNVSNIPIDYSIPVRVKKGFNRNVKPFERYPDENGIIKVKIAELERIEVRSFPGGAAGLGPMYTGYQVTGNQFRPLPIGSAFDTARGIFYWHPGPGFIGEYNFIFIKKGHDGEYKKKKIKIDINPKF